MTAENSSWSSRKRRKTLQLFGWALAWLLSYALATFGPRFWQADALSIAAIAFNLLLGVGVVMANIQHLASLDELERKISLDAMAIALGAGFVAGFGYSLLEGAALVTFDARPEHLVTLMGLVLLVAMVVGVRRHQ